MADVVSIDVPRVRAAAHAMRGSAEPLDGAMRAVSGCEFGASGPAREHVVGYLRLARAIGAWGSASEAVGRVLAATADAYDGQDAATADDVVTPGGR